MSRLGATPWKFQGLTGRRKGTSRYCVNCDAWHPTPRGLGDPVCPKTGDILKKIAPAYVPAAHLGTRPVRVRVPFRVEGL